MTDSRQIKMTVFTALFVSLVAVGAFIAIPIGPVPIVLQNMFVLLAALILGPTWGLICVAVYLLIGFVGLPVFAGGTSGVGKLFGPTGGYLIAYLPCVYITGLISHRPGKKITSDVIAMVIGSAIVYAIGVPWLSMATGMKLTKALSVGCYPFIIPDLVKIIVAAMIARTLRPVVKL